MSGNAFWREDSVYPFVHATLPAALYFATRHALLALLLMYVWESVEAALALYVSGDTFGESVADSLIGDPLVGALGIGALALLDAACGWSALVVDATTLGARLLVFVYVAAPALALFTLGAERVARMRTLLIAAYGATIVLVGLLMYAPVLAQVGAPLAVWLGLVALLALAGALRAPSSVYVRVVTVNGAAFLVALIVLAIERL